MSRGAEGDFDSVEKRVLKSEEKLACSKNGQCVKIKQWKLAGWRGLERLEGDGWNVVEGYEPDSKTCALNLGFWFDEDMAAGSTAFAALRAELGLGGAEV